MIAKVHTFKQDGERSRRNLLLPVLEDDFEAIKDILEEDEAVEWKFIATANNTSLSNNNFEL